MAKRGQDLIWKSLHADYKTTIDGRRYIMYMGKNGTQLGPLDDLPKDVFDKLFASAARFVGGRLKDEFREK